MKKSLIALAVAGTFAAPAFAATENVDVYGKLHVSVSVFDENVDAIAGDTRTRGTNDLQFSSNASRFGIKGAEDLGGGLSAIWQIESGVNLDEQNGTLANRNSFLGLKGGFGTVLLGNHDTPLKLVGRAVDLFGDTMADSRNVMGGGSDARAKNVGVYMTPNMGGFGIAVAYTTDLKGDGTQINAAGGRFDPTDPLDKQLDSGDQADNGAYNLSATYKNGPVYVGLGYGDGDYHDNAGLGAHIRLAGGFDMGSFKLVGQYDTLEANNGNDMDAFMVGGAFTMGNVVLKANYMTKEFDRSTAEPTQFTIGADYNLSKRSTVYALYAATEDGVIIGSGAGSSDQIVSGDVSRDNSVISIGMTHTF